jgi:tRNA threonylcarbamoyl adenosine modification protein YeaZ
VTWLAFDASTAECPIAVGGRNDLPEILDEEPQGANQASARLAGRIEGALLRAGLRARDLEVVVCGRGPGTFTGTRVAIATCMGIAGALGIPTVPVSTLAIVAASGPPAERVLALLDARRGEVYGAYFDTRDGIARAQSDEFIAAAQDLADRDGATPAVVLGPGADAWASSLPEALRPRIVPGIRASARGLGAIAAVARREGPFLDPAALTPTYLRRSYAELGVNRPRHAVFRSPVSAPHPDEG